MFDKVYSSQKMQIIKQNEGVEEVWLSLVYPIIRENKTEALLVLDLSKSYGEQLNNFNSPLMTVVWMMQALLIISVLLLGYLIYRYSRLRKILLFDRLTSTHTKVFLEEFFNRNEVDAYNAIFMDMDEFGWINNKYGYSSGDLVIKEFAETMMNVLSSNAKVIRTAGTEFLVIVPKDDGNFEALANKLFSTLQEKKYLLKNEVFNQTVSMSAMIIPKGNVSIYDVQRMLDVKLLEIKSKGKNALGLLGMDHSDQIKYGNMDYIKEALEEERLVCLYQPIINTKTKQIVKYEALVRLIDKENREQLISPAHFMDIIKGTSQYIKMSKLVLKQVFNVLNEYPEIEISINLDLVDLYNADMMKLISKKLYRNKILANRLTFEILESNEIRDYGQVALIFQQLKAFGSKIAIDDFGSGYANYVYLIKLDIDILKIDGSIIQELLHNPERTKIMLNSIKDLAEIYNYELVAEFVSSQEIYEIVKDLEIEYVQGYYLGEPKPLEAYIYAERN
ncbi:MAG: bifunctional diguanylate cyclase/phosphodiesterase [Sulfurovum sp.]|nr:bifunctional diguanylate cyclase/phosphodiesterase [Sulfurovum sp.]